MNACGSAVLSIALMAATGASAPAQDNPQGGGPPENESAQQAAQQQQQQQQLDSPPFPSSDYLGPVIGEPEDPTMYPLMKAIYGNTFEPGRIKIYGWINPSVNGSSSSNSNIPDSYDIVPNHLELDQLVLRIERVPDSVQTDRVDWGFRLSNIYGIDYRFTTAKGWFSSQLLEHNRLYGYDPAEAYALLYVPNVAQGMIVKIGRYISPPDIEAQLAPDNYLFTHSIMFTYDPYTFTGVSATIKLNPRWTILFGVHGGNDMAVWSESAQLNGQAIVRWVSRNNNDSIWAGVNSIGSGEFKREHDNLQQVVGTWTHRFSERIHTATEAYYMWQFDAAAGGSCINGPTRTFAAGGGCGRIIPGPSKEIGIVNYTQYELSKKGYLSVRTDYFNDIDGQRSGFATAYTSHTLGWVQFLTPLVSVRPEIRYERAYADGVTPYDNGTSKDQTKFAIDVILRF